MKMLIPFLLIFCSYARADGDTPFQQKVIGWQALGTSALTAPDQNSKSIALSVPIHIYEIEVDPRRSLSLFEANSGIELGSTIVNEDLRALLGLTFDGTIGIGAHTSGPLMLYGMGNGGLKTVFRMNGIPENELGFSTGIESGIGISGDRLLVTAGGLLDARVSTLNPEGDYAEIDAGARIRVALKDLLYFRAQFHQSISRTRDDVMREGSLTLDYRLPDDFRPWTPSLKVMVGVDARFFQTEAADQSDHQYSVAVHLTFYKEPK